MYEDLVSLVVELARRYTRNSSILDKHANPLLTIAAAEEDIEDQGARHDPTASNFTEKVDAARIDTEQQREDGFLFLTGTKQRVEYATWDGDLGSSMEQIDRIKQELHLLTGLLNFLQAPDAPMSRRGAAAHEYPAVRQHRRRSCGTCRIAQPMHCGRSKPSRARPRPRRLPGSIPSMCWRGRLKLAWWTKTTSLMRLKTRKLRETMATFRESLKTTIEAARPDLTYWQASGAIRTGMKFPSFYTRFGGFGERFTAQWEVWVLVRIGVKIDVYDTVGEIADDVFEALYGSVDTPAHSARGLPRVPKPFGTCARYVWLMVVSEQSVVIGITIATDFRDSPFSVSVFTCSKCLAEVACRQQVSRMLADVILLRILTCMVTCEG